MDSRNNLQNPFARPLSQPSARGLRQAPIPHPPFSLQTPAPRLPPSLNNDPFLPRRNERDEPRQEPPKPSSQSPYTLGSYATSLAREGLGTTMERERRDRVHESSHGVSWMPRAGDGRTDRYRHHTTEGSSLPPPPPSSSFPPSAHTTSAHRDIDRLPEHRATSPRMYGAVHDNPPPPPPPPPPFGGRPMLPPSPQYNAQASMSRVPPPPPPFSGGRELPALSSTTTRPGSSMSISSMLGSEPGKPARDPATAPRMNGASPPSSYSSSVQQAAPASSPTRSSNSNGYPSRRSPEIHHVSQDPVNRPFRAYSGGTPQRSYTAVKAGSPDGARHGPFSATAASKYSPTSESGILQEWRQRNRSLSTGRPQTRPSSQPNGYNILPVESDRAIADLEAHRQVAAKQEEDKKARDDASRQTGHDRVSSFDYLSRQEQLERQRRLEQEAQSTAHGTTREERPSGLYPFMTRSSVFSEPNTSAPQPELESYANRLISDAQSKSSTPKGPFSDESLRRLQEERQRLGQQTKNQTSSASRPRFSDNADERQPQSYPHNVMLATSASESNANADGAGRQHRVGEDAGQSHRSMLSMIENKRLGRTSPIPQAVQGAQVQKRGPSTDPTIKNEFSRMFAGLGTGVSSTGMNSGTSTPFPPPSPKPSTEPERRQPFNGRGELVEFARARNGSKIGKRASKKVKDEDAKETEVIDGRSVTVPTGTRGIKRKTVHHHHHHHDHEHAHHHHHHRQDAQNGTPVRLTGSATNPISHHHHHHHHHHPDGTIHYHSHSKVPTVPHKTTPLIPSTTINNDPILDKVRDLPRHHLGSILYTPTVEPPSSPVSLDSKFVYTSSPFTIPRCDGKENCTMTIRIPRFYLSNKEREQVCLRRAVWGTDVYSDDSDPLAAAIHAGWIRGDWGGSVDFSALEINPVNEEIDTKQTELTTPPSIPMLPPSGKDLHLTILILPALESYASRICHGIKSRAWGNDHDGLSYRVEKMAWVDEKAAQGEERGGEARRKRLRMTTGKGTGPPLRLGLGKSLGAGKVGMAAA